MRLYTFALVLQLLLLIPYLFVSPMLLALCWSQVLLAGRREAVCLRTSASADAADCL